MPNFCTYCGKVLEKGVKYCTNCGELVIEKIPKQVETKKEDIVKAKKKINYILTSSQRNIFLLKILPTMLVGATIWLISEIIFSAIFIELEFTIIFLAFYVSMIIIEIILFTLLFFIAKSNKIQLGLIIFFLFSFIAGILSLPIIMITEFLPQVHMFVFLSLGAILIVCLMGTILRENYFSKGYLWMHIIIFLVGMAMLEGIFLLIFSIRNFLLTIPISLAYILVVSLTTMFYGAKSVQKNSEKDPWIYIFFKIEGILLLALVIAAVIVVIVLVLIVIGIACGGSDLNFSGFSGGGSKSKRRKKKA
ncbi:MAG: zinc-ribbon domain-containing protein [Promethearchaeota archaeon]